MRRILQQPQPTQQREGSYPTGPGVHQTGCNANLFYADAPKPQMEVMTEAFWDYVAKASQTADDTIQMIKKTQFGQDVRYVSL